MQTERALPHRNVIDKEYALLRLLLRLIVITGESGSQVVLVLD